MVFKSITLQPTLNPTLTLPIIEKARAKINLNLQVTGKRQNGYHNLSSLFVFTDFGDLLQFSPCDTFRLHIKGEFADKLSTNLHSGMQVNLNSDEHTNTYTFDNSIALDTLANNSIIRASKALALMLEVPPCAEIVLDKRIPIASGVGGGTADAAATIRGLLRLWQRTLSDEQLQSLAVSLGADVPACLYNKPVLVSGIGEKLDKAPILPKNTPLVLVNPLQPVETKHIFSGIDKKGFTLPFTFKEQYTNVTDLIADLHKTSNDLLSSACLSCPTIYQCLDSLNKAGADFVSMSGSGATCFGIFSAQDTADNACKNIIRHNPDWWAVSTFIC